MITNTHRARTGTTVAVGVAVALAALLAGCSSSPAPASSSPPAPGVAAMVSRHPACAGHTRSETDGAVSCAAEGRLWLVYVLGSERAAADAAVSLRTLHPTGMVDVDGTDVWVTE